MTNIKKFIPERYRRPSIAYFALLITVLGTTSCQGQPRASAAEPATASSASTPQRSTTASSEAESVAAVMWQKILTTCPVQGATSTFFVVPDEIRFEFRNAWTRFFPRDVTEADRLNGLQAHGVTLLSGSPYRISVSGPSWMPWKEGLDRRAADALRPVWNSGEVLPSFLGQDVWGERVVMEKRGNHWYFKWNRTMPEDFDPDVVATHKQSCAVLTSNNPF